MSSDFMDSTFLQPNGRGVPPIIGDPDPFLMPTKAALFSAYEEHQLEQLAKNFKLTPATLAFHLENKRIGPDDPLKWYPSPFLMQISLRVAMGIAKGGARIIISAPPRHGKSRISTIHTPLWVLENFENYNVVTTTYGADLSEDFSREIRDFIIENPEDLEIRLRKDASRVAKFVTTKNSSLTAIGLGGPITGRGAHVLLIDDYIKQIKEADSQAYRDYVWNWFRSTAMTRLEPNASVIIIATRWHHDDLIGRIIRDFGTTENGGDWEYIKYHARARENDPLGRQVGEALFPQRYPVKVLEERKKMLGSVYYDAIFDQEPHENDGDLTDKTWIKKITRDQIPKRPLRLVRVWDFAGSEEKKADYTAGGLQAANDEDQSVILLNMIRKQLSAAKVEELVKKTAQLDGPNVDIVICQETGSAGKAVVDYYQRTVLKGYRVHGVYWNKNKKIIAQPWLAGCEDGRFYILDAPWNQSFLDEFEHFPSEGSGYHDDQMDVCANGWIFLHGRMNKKLTFGRGSAKNKAQITAPTPEEVAEITAQQAEYSPHQGTTAAKIAQFGRLGGLTFGRNKRQRVYYN